MFHHKDLNSEDSCPLQHQHVQCAKKPKNLKGPLRVIKLCVLGIFVPTLLIAVPLYLRCHVYGSQLYPLAMSDMRLLDNKVSTTWCQRQNVRVNATFNAFLLSQAPLLSPHLKPLTMVRHLILEDDTKEYWGFYLLKGSSVTVSTCVRWPGASLIVIRGHKHLHECAYIGDNSSEELDELMEAIREGTYVAPGDAQNMNLTDSDESSAPSNDPETMRRHRSEVEFHNPSLHKNNPNHTIKEKIDPSTDVTDPKMLRKILDSLQEKAINRKKRPVKKIDNDVRVEDLAIPRNSTIAKGEGSNFQIEPPHSTKSLSQETLDTIIKKLDSLGEKKRDILQALNEKYRNQKSGEDSIKRVPHIDMIGRHYSKPAVDFDENIDRAKRSIEISNAYDGQLTEDDEENDAAIEEGFSPDGIADHRGTINETTLNDYSNSEFWSSFSSSEEALLNCAGLILNLPLTPHHKCSPDLTESEAEETYLANTITYKVPVNGYYFFVFNSENEVQPNYIRAQFHLQKAVYNVSEAVSTCSNSSSSCSMDLRFFSSQKLVMELPVKDNDTLWNEEFVVISECEPRTALYAICVISVPVMVVLFAFS